MYAKGLTTRQISEQIEDIYGFACSESFISDVTDKILKDIDEWQHRPLNSVYPIVFIDACHFSVRDNGMVRKLAAYVMLGINSEGFKEIISLSIGENESVNNTCKKLNRQRSVFPSSTALLKALYLSTLQITKKWNQALKN